MRRRAGPVTEISVFATEISVTELEIFPIWTLQPGYRDETFSTDAHGL